MLRTAQKKGKIPKHVTLFLNLQKILGAPYRNATAKFKIQSGPLERGHPRYQSRPESVTLSVANSRTKMKSPHIVHPNACCTQAGLRCGDLDRRISRSDPGRRDAGMLADGLGKMAPKSARLDLFCGKKHRIQHTKSQMGVAYGSNVSPQCFRRIILQKFGNVAPKSVCLDIFCGKNQIFPANFLKNSKESSKIRVPVWMEGSPFLERLKSFSFSDRTPVLGAASLEDSPPGTAIGALTELKLQCTFRLHRGNRGLSRLET